LKCGPFISKSGPLLIEGGSSEPTEPPGYGPASFFKRIGAILADPIYYYSCETSRIWEADKELTVTKSFFIAS